MDFRDIVMSRYATKKFDGRKIPEEKMRELLELIRYSASAYNLQPWKIKIVSDKKTKELIAKASFDQPQITTCSHLLVFMADTDIKGHIDAFEKKGASPAYIQLLRAFDSRLSDDEKIVWARNQTYLALGNALNGAKALGFDSCPMEGFKKDEVRDILSLPENLHLCVLCPIGYGDDTPRPKTRLEIKDIIIQ